MIKILSKWHFVSVLGSWPIQVTGNYFLPQWILWNHIKYNHDNDAWFYCSPGKNRARVTIIYWTSQFDGNSFKGARSEGWPICISKMMISSSQFNHDEVIKWIHFPRYWTFVWGIRRSPVNSPHKGQWLGALMFSFICPGINAWVKNREAGDLRRPLWRHCNHGNAVVVVVCVCVCATETQDPHRYFPAVSL